MDLKNDTKKAAKGVMNNVVARNIILAVSLLIIGLFAAHIFLGIFTRHNHYKTVPDMIGVSLDEAKKIAHRHGGLRIEINDSLYVPIYEGGVILEQKPAAGTKVKSGRRIFVTTNTYHQKMVQIPYVAGFSLRQAKNNLETAGLEIEKLVYVSDMANDYILQEFLGKQEIKRSSKVETEVGSGITLVVGRNDSHRAIVPKVVGLSLREAKSRLWDAGLNVGEVAYDNNLLNMIDRRNARVYRQSPNHGATVTPGSSISLTLSLDDQKVDNGIVSSDRSSREAEKQRKAQQTEEEQ